MRIGHPGPAGQQQRQPVGQARGRLLPGPGGQGRALQQRRARLVVALHGGASEP